MKGKKKLGVLVGGKHPHRCSVCTPCTLKSKSNEAKLKYAGLAPENGFSPAYDLSLLRLVKGVGKWFRS